MSKKLLYLCFALTLVLGLMVGCQKETAQPVQEKACIYAKCDSYVANGADILFYSDDRSTLKAAVYGDSGKVYTAGNIEFEGATADAYETTLTVTDPTADRTITLPNATGAVALSTLTTNAPDIANSVWLGTNGLVFEGATADDYEGSLTVTDPTADRTWTLPDVSGTVHVNEATQNVTANNITASGWITISTFLQLSPSSQQTIVEGTAGITPTTSLHQITAAGVVSNTMSVTGFTAGQVVALVNVGANTITIIDTGTTMLGGNRALGQYDTLMIFFDGTNWVELAFTNN